MSEFRQDLVSGDWVIIAPARAKRPDELVKHREPRKPAPKNGCPFENLEKSGNAIIASVPKGKSWRIAVIQNKYPALEHGARCATPLHHGIYLGKTGVGNHELVITRDHQKNFADLSPAAAAEVFAIFQARFTSAAKDACLSYISAFANWGPAAGASLWHPHYQIIALPVVPPHIAHSLRGSETYFAKHKRCVRCDIIRTELKEKKRIVAENRLAVAFAPYASKRPFEISVMPKSHSPFFEKTSAAAIRAVASLTQTVLRGMRKNLADPDFNFFIHSAPIDGNPYAHHHWHIEIVPVNAASPPGGFEASTIININAVDPNEAARIIRG